MSDDPKERVAAQRKEAERKESLALFAERCRRYAAYPAIKLSYTTNDDGRKD